MACDGDDDRGGDDVVKFEIGIGGDKAEQVIAWMAAAVGCQRKKLGEQRGKRVGAVFDGDGVSGVGEHSDDRRGLLTKQSGGVDV